MIKKGIIQIGIFFLYLISLCPMWFLYLLSDLIYWVVYKLVRYRRAVVYKNLKASFPEKTEAERLSIEKQYYRFLGDIIVETVKMASISKRSLLKRVQFSGLEQLENHFKHQQSVLLCAGHYGNWEWGTLALRMHIHAEELAIYKPLNSEAFNTWFLKIRSRFGNVMVAMRRTMRLLVQYKDITHVMLFAHDQSTGGLAQNQYYVPFLNQPTATLLGLEKVAVLTKRPVYYMKLTVIKRGYYHIECVPLCLQPELTKPYEITHMHMQFLEQMILDIPQYWVWSHNRWKLKPQ